MERPYDVSSDIIFKDEIPRRVGIDPRVDPNGYVDLR